MKIKVYGGTKQDRHLCLSCQHSFRIEGQRDSERIDMCTNDDIPTTRIPFRVAECKGYLGQTDVSLLEMRRKGAYLVPLASGRYAALTLGQIEDYEFMLELQRQDRGETQDAKNRKEVTKILKAAK